MSIGKSFLKYKEGKVKDFGSVTKIQLGLTVLNGIFRPAQSGDQTDVILDYHRQH